MTSYYGRSFDKHDFFTAKNIDGSTYKRKLPVQYNMDESVN